MKERKMESEKNFTYFYNFAVGFLHKMYALLSNYLFPSFVPDLKFPRGGFSLCSTRVKLEDIYWQGSVLSLRVAV